MFSEMANCLDPDQTALSRAVWSGFALFAILSDNLVYEIIGHSLKTSFQNGYKFLFFWRVAYSKCISVPLNTGNFPRYFFRRATRYLDLAYLE